MKVGLFIPCYINAVYPQVGRASCELLRRVGCEVDSTRPAAGSRWPTPVSNGMRPHWPNA